MTKGVWPVVVSLVTLQQAQQGRGSNARSTKLMMRPVRPPMRPAAPLSPRTAPARAGPAADVTRDRPWEALEATLEAVCRALAAASEAVEDGVVDWKRRGAAGRRRAMRAGAANVDGRRAGMLWTGRMGRAVEMRAASKEGTERGRMGWKSRSGRARVVDGRWGEKRAIGGTNVTGGEHSSTSAGWDRLHGKRSVGDGDDEEKSASSGGRGRLDGEEDDGRE